MRPWLLKNKQRHLCKVADPYRRPASVSSVSEEHRIGRIREMLSIFGPDLIPVVISAGDCESHEILKAWLSPELASSLKAPLKLTAE